MVIYRTVPPNVYFRSDFTENRLKMGNNRTTENVELKGKLKSYHMLLWRFAQSLRIGWVGYLVRIAGTKNACTVLVGKRKGRDQLACLPVYYYSSIGE